MALDAGLFSPFGFGFGPAEKLASRGVGGLGTSIVFAGSRPTIAMVAVLTGALIGCASGGAGSSVTVLFTSTLAAGGGTKVRNGRGSFVSIGKSFRIAGASFNAASGA